MSAKRIFAAMLLLIASYVVAGSLMHWNSGSDQQKQPDVATPQPTPAASSKTARTGDANSAPTGTPAKGSRTAPQETVKKTTPAKPSKPSQIASFVELKLNTGEPQLLAGRASKGTTVTAIKDGTVIGTATATSTGTWSIPLDPPITDKAYTLTLKSTDMASIESGAESSITIVGQSADITVDDAGRTTIAIKPPPVTPAGANPKSPVDVASAAAPKNNPTPTNRISGAPAKTKEDKPAGNELEQDKEALDGIMDQASRLANAATEKFTDVIGAGESTEDKAEPDGSNGKTGITTASKTTSPADTKSTDAARTGQIATGAIPPSSPLEFTRAELQSPAGENTTLQLAGKSVPGAELGIFRADRMLAGTIARPDGTWSLTMPFTTPPGPVEIRIDQFGAQGTVIASQKHLARRPRRKDGAIIATPKEKPAPETDGNQLASTSGADNTQSGNKVEKNSPADNAGKSAGIAPGTTLSTEEQRVKRAARRRVLARRARRSRQAIARTRTRQRAAHRTTSRIRLNRLSSTGRRTATRYIKRRTNEPPTSIRITRLNRISPRPGTSSLRPVPRLRPPAARGAARYLRRAQP